MKVHTVIRVITTSMGATVVPIRSYDSPEPAEELKEGVTQEMGQMLESELVTLDRAGAPTFTGMTLGIFLQKLGITNIAHRVMTQDVHSSNIEIPDRPRIVVPGR